VNSPLVHLKQSGRLHEFYIDGRWIDPRGRDRAAIVNPATEREFADIPLGNEEDVEHAVSAARRAFPGWARTSPADRATLLDNLYVLIHQRLDLIARALTMEMGAAINYARNTQVPLAAEHIRVARDNARTYPFTSQRGSTAIAREPIGVCGLITPWNWPLYQITAKVGPALAAGCTVVLKPSELSPLSALLFAEMIEDSGFPPGVFNLVNGTGPVVGASLSAHRDVDMISITGSTRAGVLVAQAAAPTVKRVAQELGGKSPNIILPDAEMPRAVALGVAAAFRNLGQSCSAPTRMIVPRSQQEHIEKLASTAALEIVVGDPMSERSTHGPVANRPQFDRVQHMISVGIAEGAKLVAGGTGQPNGLEVGYYVQPTIFSDVNPEMEIAQQEIFGPVLSIIPYDTIDEAIEIANNTVYGLGAHVQGSDPDTVRTVAAQIRSGQVHLNYPAWDPNAPFGGYKQSGNGREYGIEGMEDYLEIKSILGFYP